MRLGFSLLRIGRKDDAGIDLIGHWVLAPLRDPLCVIVQCKARKVSLNPSHVREMEGSFQGTPADWKKKDVLGLLVTTRKATKGIFEALGQSRWPMGFILISREGSVQQFVWNRAAAGRGLEGVGVTVRYTPRVLSDVVEEEEEEEEEAENNATPAKKKKPMDKFKNTGTLRDIQLTWMGSPIFPGRANLDQETLKLMQYVAPDDSCRPLKYKYKTAKERIKSGRPRVLNRAPSPRGGVVGGKPGRPKGSTTIKPEPTEIKKRGRPKGSKNKPKPAIDAG